MIPKSKSKSKTKKNISPYKIRVKMANVTVLNLMTCHNYLLSFYNGQETFILNKFLIIPYKIILCWCCIDGGCVNIFVIFVNGFEKILR